MVSDDLSPQLDDLIAILHATFVALVTIVALVVASVWHLWPLTLGACLMITSTGITCGRAWSPMLRLIEALP